MCPMIDSDGLLVYIQERNDGEMLVAVLLPAARSFVPCALDLRS